MADEPKNGKSYANLSEQDEAFGVRTMKKDIERLRQGLPLRDGGALTITEPARAAYEPPRRLATEVQAHDPLEQPPGETATPLPKTMPQDIRAPQFPQQPVYVPLQPATPVRPVAPAAAETRPIEAMQALARPAVPVKPQQGRVEVEKVSAGEKTSLFTRIFPTQRRLIEGIIVLLMLLIVSGYLLFAYFGKPLPGARFIFPSASVSPSPAASPRATSTPSASVIASPSPSPAATPATKTSYLPASRIGIVEVAGDETQLDFIDKLTKLAYRSNQNPGDFTRVMVRHKETKTDFTTREFLALLGIAAPQEFVSELAEEPTIFFYAPRERTPGIPAGQIAPSHIGMLVPVTHSKEKLRGALATWETTLAGDIVPLALGRQWQAGATTLFQSNMFQGALIRYQNIPDPYLSADYAVYEGSVPPLFVLTTSRESMFAVIGTLNYQSE